MVIYNRATLPTAPDWVEIDDFELMHIDQNDAQNGIREMRHSDSPREVLIGLIGEVIVEWEGGRVTLKRRDWMELPQGEFTVTSARYVSQHYPCEALRIAGDWKEVNTVGIFHFREDKPLEVHYHDYNEYWFVYRGSFEGVYDGNPIEMDQGLMLATRMGHEHGVPDPKGILEGVGFSTERHGERRNGHLHRETDGIPTPL